MADNVGYTEGAGTTIAADEIAGVKIQRVKIVQGADGVNDGDVASGNPLPVAGTVTADAGTDLNTSLLALEAGGNLAGAAISLAVVDDWDESDRAKVNPIVGQAGIAGGTGVDGATVPRVTLATNVALPAGTNAIGKLSANSGVDIGDVDVTSAVITGGAVAHDGAAGSVKPLQVGGFASAAAPTDVSADADAVQAWYLRNGAQATVVTAAGALVGGDASNGLDVDVTRLPALVAGSANIGDVDVLTVPAPLSTTGGGTEATALRVTIASNSTGVLAVSQSGTWNVTNVSGTVSLPTGASTETTLGSVKTSVELIDDAIVADDAAFTPATTKVLMAGFEFDDAAPDSVNEGDAGAARMSANRNVYTTLRDAAGNERGANVNASSQLSVSVDNSVTVSSHAVTNAGTFATQVDGAALTSLQLIDDVVAVLGTATYSETTTKAAVMGAVRRDADTTLVDTTNEIAPLQVNSAGQLKTEVFDGGDSHTVDNNGTFVTQVDGAALTALQLIDDIVYTDDTSTHATGTSKGALIMAAATPTDTSVNANDIGAVAMTTDRRLLVDASGVAVPVTDNSSSLSVDWNGTQPVTGSGTATGALRVEVANNGTGVIATVSAVTTVGTITPGTAASSLGKAEDVAHGSGDTGVAVWQVRDDTLSVFSNAENDYEPFHSDVNGATWVHPTDSIAHDAADAGNGIKVAMKAVTTTSTQTLVSANDRTDVYADLDGTQLARNQVPLGDLLSERVSNTDGAATAFTTFDNAAGKRNYITSVTVHNAHASTNGYVDFRDGAAGSVLWTFPLTATAGTTHNFNPPLRQPTAATALAFDVSAAITTVYISINGFKSKL